MIKPNPNYQSLKESYLFSEIAKRVAEFQGEHPEVSVIRMGIGDVTRPLSASVVEELHHAVEEMGRSETFHGYGPEQGYGFVKDAVLSYYAERKVELAPDEIFISDGAKSDLGNILDILSKESTVLIPDPVYPVYVDTNLMDGRKIIYMDANEENGFLPLPGEGMEGDIIYLCSPNNPTGAVYSYADLTAWVAFARKNHSLILFDAAYEAFVEGDLPRSIYEIEGAKECAIEFCSLSKTAGFTGTRMGYTVVPKDLTADGVCLNKLWLRRQTTKFNGVSYIVQKGAMGVFSEEGRKEIKENIAYDTTTAEIITKTLDHLGIWYTGGKHSPYIWLKCPKSMTSWEFFDAMLNKIGVVGTPGEGFGKNGKYFFRLTAFSTHEATIEAMKRLKEWLE